MKYCYLLLLTFIITPFISCAQTSRDQDPRTYFVGLQNGQKIYAKRVQMKSPLLKSNYFLLDDTIRYAVSAVKYYQNENGYFLKVPDLFTGRDEFAERVMSGRISKFFITRTSYNDFNAPGYGYGGFGGYRSPGGWGAPSRRTIYFFTKDDGELQNFSFENLTEAMSDNPGSLELLNRYRKDRYVDTGISIAGAALLVVGLTQSFNNSSSTTGSFQVSPVVYAGVGLISIPWLKGFFKKDKINQAIELYNYQKKD